MSGRQCLGAAIIASPFLAIFGTIAFTNGALFALAFFVIIFALIAFIGVGVELLNDEDPFGAFRDLFW